MKRKIPRWAREEKCGAWAARGFEGSAPESCENNPLSPSVPKRQQACRNAARRDIRGRPSIDINESVRGNQNAAQALPRVPIGPGRLRLLREAACVIQHIFDLIFGRFTVERPKVGVDNPSPVVGLAR